MSIDVLKHAVDEGIEAGNWSAVDDWLVQDSGEPFGDEFLTYVLQLLADPRFLQAPGSHNFLAILGFEWDRLSLPQRNELLPALVAAYPKFTDWMSWFAVTELLGKHYKSLDALGALRELRRTPNDLARSLVPMGLDYIVRESDDMELAQSAYAELLLMRDDPSEVVRGEVQLSMDRIGTGPA